MQKRKNTSLLFRFLSKVVTPLKIITPILLFLLLFGALLTPLNAALSPARDLTGTWQSALSEKYYEMDPSDPSTRMNDVTVTYTMIITQSGNSLNIVLNVDESSWVTDSAYWNETACLVFLQLDLIKLCFLERFQAQVLPLTS
ncbi:MAG: hypothetical protein ABSD92_13905 [Candidatus Bathyarchaeia archaeon]|jgi:hypothetical protein